MSRWHCILDGCGGDGNNADGGDGDNADGGVYVVVLLMVVAEVQCSLLRQNSSLWGTLGK